MKFDKPNRQLGQALASTGIDAKNYADRAATFLCGRDGFVIRAIDGAKGSMSSREEPTEAQWIAWVRYFDGKGLKRAFLIEHGLGTVPTEWPEDFDLEWPTSDREARLPRRIVAYDPDRAETANRVRQATAHMTAKPTKRPDPWKMSSWEAAEAYMREVGQAPLDQPKTPR